MKKTFSIFELIFIISIISLIYTVFLPKVQINKKNDFIAKTVLYLNQTRYKAFIDDKYDSLNPLWFKKRWTMKFLRCKKSVGGIYYTIYSDKNMSGHPSASESLKDFLSNKNIYSSNSCKENDKNSKYVLLTKNFNIIDVNISCNNTTSLGQISFGADGNVYSKLSTNNYKIKEPCKIEFLYKDGDKGVIIINNKTGYIQEKI